MALFAITKAGAAIALGCGMLAQSASAETQSVFFNRLNETATVLPALAGSDTLFVDTLVTQETGSLAQDVTFTVGAGVTSFSGTAAWLVTPAASSGPRLVGVNIDVLDSTKTVVFSDTFQGLLANFAHSTLGGSIGPGTYTLSTTGNGVRDSSLDISLTFAGAVPEPQTWALMLAGLATVGFIGHRRSGG